MNFNWTKILPGAISYWHLTIPGGYNSSAPCGYKTILWPDRFELFSSSGVYYDMFEIVEFLLVACCCPLGHASCLELEWCSSVSAIYYLWEDVWRDRYLALYASLMVAHIWMWVHATTRNNQICQSLLMLVMSFVNVSRAAFVLTAIWGTDWCTL